MVSTSHPNIITYYESVNRKVDQNKKAFSYILMEYSSHGDLATLLTNQNGHGLDEKLARTLFHNLIEGLSFLHENEMAHLDLKPENLLISEDYKLKIIDFDLLYKKGDRKLKGRGTKGYRAPELSTKTCNDPAAADIFSAALVLFTMMTGCVAFTEGEKEFGFDLHEMVLSNDDNFWRIHSQLAGINQIVDNDFKDLFWSMIGTDPLQRIDTNGIKKSKWYRKPIYNETELATILSKMVKNQK